MNSYSPSVAAPVAPPASRVERAGWPWHRLLAVTAAAIVAVAGVFFGVRYLRFAFTHEETDDAQVEGDISPVLPRVNGYVARVLVRDNERVAAGQPLVEIDPAELDLQVARARTAEAASEAEQRTAEAALAEAQAALAVSRAAIATAAVRRDQTAADLREDRSLFAGGAITVRQGRDSQAAADAAAAQFAVAERQAEAAAAQVAVAAAKVRSARDEVAQERADLDFARLQRSYATVTAPIAGLVARKEVEPGQFVQAGQTLLSVVSDSGVWVVANFKETQLTRMQAGQAVAFTADSYPGHVFRGRIDSIAGATGARFALLPPDNASGNFVKVTQRVPVKIALDGGPDPRHPLRPGMSVDAVVETGR